MPHVERRVSSRLDTSPLIRGQQPGRLGNSVKRGSWRRIVLLLVVGNLSMTRSFAYLGFAPAGIFVNETTLLLFLLRRGRYMLARLLRALASQDILSGASWAFFALSAYAITQLARGLFNGYGLFALQVSAAYFYPLFFFVGILVGERVQGLLQRAALLLAKINGFYGVAYVLILERIGAVLPGTDVPLFGQPAGSAIAILGLLVFSTRRDMGHWALMTLNLFVLLAIQVRAEWLGLVVAGIIWIVLLQGRRRVALASGLLAVLVIAAAATDVTIPAASRRGGEISVRSIAGRALAAVSPELASEYTPEAAAFAGTVDWRRRWWRGVILKVGETEATTAIGLAPGYPLWTLNPELRGTEIRTPHNYFIFLLGYSGWIGVILYGLFLVAVARLLVLAYRASSSPFGLLVFVYSLCVTLVAPYLDTPFGAVPIYLLLGLAAASATAKEPGLG